MHVYVSTHTLTQTHLAPGFNIMSAHPRSLSHLLPCVIRLWQLPFILHTELLSQVLCGCHQLTSAQTLSPEKPSGHPR